MTTTRKEYRAEAKRAETERAEIIRRGRVAAGPTRTERAEHLSGVLQIADTTALALAATGHIDLQALAKKELASRGLDAHGQWLGFEAARRFWESR